MRFPGRRLTAASIAFAFMAAACGTPAPSPTTSAPATTPRSTGPAPVSPGISSTPATGGPYAEAFVAALGADDLTTHVAQTAELTTTMGGTEQTLTATAEGDIAGDDLAIVIRVAIDGQELTQELRVVDDTAWVRADDEWQSAPRSTVDGALVGLLDNIRVVEDPARLRYAGPETVEGEALHRLTAVGAVPYLPASGGSGQYDALDVWVEEDGTPVLVRGEFTAQDAAGNAGRGSTEIRFSQFGGPIVIVPPTVPASGAP